MPTSRETSLKWGTEAVCALATRGKIRTNDRIFRITMSVQIIEQRKSINHEGHEGGQRKASTTEGTGEHRGNPIGVLLLCTSVSSVVRNAVPVEYRFSCFDRDPGRESYENVC